ncbi:hypothetical protein Tco_0337838 [Tanacetum coccineum]
MKKDPVDDMDNLLLRTLNAMFEPQVEDTIWTYQQGLTKVKNWKLDDSCGVYLDYEVEMAYELLRLIRKQLQEGIDQGLGSTSGIRACALRNFDLEVMEFETAQTNTTAKLPILKLGEYEMWEMRIKKYFQVQDYALWEVIEDGNSWVSIPQTSQEEGTSVTKMSVHVTTEEKIKKMNDVKARSMLLMSIPNEHQLTFSQLAILGVVITQEDLNSKFLRSLPPEWNTHVIVWMNKPDIETMSIDDLYNNFKIVEQEVKKTIGASNSNQNMAFMSAPSTSSTNDEVSTASPKVSTGSTNVNTASTQDSTASLSDATVYAFLANHPNGSQLVHEDLEQIHEDDLEEMDLKNPRSQDNRPRNNEQGSRNHENTRRAVNVEETSSKAMLAIDGLDLTGVT